MEKYKVYERPGKNKKVVSEVVEIIKLLSEKWFTNEVQRYVPDDLKFQDLIAMYEKKEMIGFIIYTCIDGKMCIMLMAIRPEDHNKGYGTKLYLHFEKMIKRYGIEIINVQTVPEEANENYKGTIRFYEKHGFEIVKRYKELWEHGAIELEKQL